jgi:leader peptidase (prepilin peptidase)/N-methyltransferase
METVLGTFVAILIGWITGAAINYLSDILPAKRRIARPICPACGEEQSLTNAIFPLGKCPTCGKRHSTRTWLVLAAATGIAIWMWFAPRPGLGFVPSMFLVLYFGVVVVIDLEHHLILHPVSLAGGVLGLGIGIWLHGFLATLIGGLGGFVIMFLLYLFGNAFAVLASRLRGVSLTEGAMGFGDVTLSGVLGLMLGWPGILIGLVIGIVIGGLISLVYLIVSLLLRRYRAFTAIPYGPFLVAGAVLLLFFRGFLLVNFGP